MPYEIDLHTDRDSGLDRYTISLTGRLEPAEARHLGDWLAAASQNPTATFTIDLSRAAGEKEGPVARLLARSARLRERGRVELVRNARAGSLAALLPLA